jgi:3-dehydroquinate synthase
MEKIRVSLADRSYDIFIGTNILKKIKDNIKSFGLSPKIAIVSNPTVFSLYGKTVLSTIKKAGFDALTVIIPDGEVYKDHLWLEHIYKELLTHKLDRASALIALGGGVVGDITGYAASTYMRGISYIQIPTTLLAQVDSSVGGKTGINHKLGKNMIGTFWQPRLVWIDVDTLKTLPKKELVAGIAEVIKYGVIYDEELFHTLETQKDKILKLDRNVLVHIIKRSCEIKADVVSKDERESGLRSILNFGHTIGHAIETATDYKKYLHGEAVALGMCLEARLSQELKFIDKKAVVRIKNLVDSFGLPSTLPTDIDMTRILASMQLDKKAVAGALKFVLPERIGSVRIEKGIKQQTIKKLMESR